MTYRVLFLINGLGLGNSTRSHAIIQRLAEYDVRVQVMTSGNGLWYFHDRDEVEAIHEIESLYYASNEGRISIAGTIMSFVEFSRILRRNAEKLGRLLEHFMPQAVVIDSIYSFWPMKKRKIPIVALNNSDVIHVSYRRLEDRPASIRPQFYAVEEMDYLFHRVVPDLTLSPSLNPGLPAAGRKFQRIGPIIRKGYSTARRSRDTLRVLVMLSGSKFGTPVLFQKQRYDFSIDVVGRAAPEGTEVPLGVAYHGKLLDNREFVRNADLVVLNGGFSAVSEMFCLRKPMVVIPVPNHAEQWVNGQTIVDLGVGMISTEERFEEAIFESINRIDEFRSCYDLLPAPVDGARQAAKAIVNVLEGQ